jgi:hypothetical protein
MRAVVAGSIVVAGLLSAAPALAQTLYSGSVSSGRNTGGATACPTYGMKMDVTVSGTAVNGTFQQTGRDQRKFAATADAAGNFRTETVTGGNAKMRVTGSIKPTEMIVKLDGYCIFDFKLAKK